MGGGRKGELHETEQKLLFILVHQKAYPLQTLLGEVFEFSQSRVNEWVHRLLPILKRSFGRVRAAAGTGAGALCAERGAAWERPDLIIDGTERRRQRPKNPEKQAAALQWEEEDAL